MGKRAQDATPKAPFVVTNLEAAAAAIAQFKYKAAPASKAAPQTPVQRPQQAEPATPTRKGANEATPGPEQIKQEPSTMQTTPGPKKPQEAEPSTMQTTPGPSKPQAAEPSTTQTTPGPKKPQEPAVASLDATPARPLNKRPEPATPASVQTTKSNLVFFPVFLCRPLTVYTYVLEF